MTLNIKIQIITIEKSKIQKIHLDPNIKNNVSEVANLILEISNKI